MKDYNHKEIEAKWQKEWTERNMFKTKANPQNKMYILTEFPYPSGNLHVGHWYAFAVTDIFARYMHHIGRDVFFPFGFDSFGLPAENAAIKRGLNPKTWTYSNIEHMIEQVKSMGTMIDWDTQVITSDPEYYRWTQWLFLQFYKKGLVKHEQTHVNWCPSCKTVLANEQLEGGACERCGSIVEQKEMKQWNIEITKYADRLIDDLDTLNWPHHIKEAQKNWIGRSHGSFFTFNIKANDGIIPAEAGVQSSIKVFTTRPDTFMGVTYVVVAPEHDLVQTLKPSISNWSEVQAYIDQTNKKTDLDRQSSKDKTGIELQGIKAVHPATGREIPVFISDYVIATYGTGCVMAVPAHDERDFEFAQKHNLEIKQVIAPFFIDKDNVPQEGKEWSPRKNVQAIVKHPTEEKIIQLQWKKVPWKTFVIGGVEDGETYEDAIIREVKEETGYINFKKIEKLGWEMESHFYAKHKDINRQAFTQVFVIELADLNKEQLSEEENEKHDVVWVPISEVNNTFWPCSELPEIVAHLEKSHHAFVGEGKLINSGEFDSLTSQEAADKITQKYGEKTTTYKLKDWSVSRQRYWGCPIPMIHCTSCGTLPVPEEHLPVVLPDMDKIEMRDDGKSPLAHNKEWVEVTCPKCGASAQRETDTLDTFVDSSWYYTRYIDPQNNTEIASKDKKDTWLPIDFYSGGSEHTTRHLLYARFVYKVMFDLHIVSQTEPFLKRNNRGLILGPDGQKMSKSKGNVIDPDELVERVGSDVVRSYLAFMGPYGEAGSYPWDPNGVVGIRRFFERVCTLADKISTEDSKESIVALHTMLAHITTDFEHLKFNTALSKIMICVNVFEKNMFSKDTFSQLLIVLDMFAPHLAQELWSQIHGADFVFTQPFPKADSSILADQMIKIAVQVNGKTRAVIEVSPQSTKEEILSIVKNSPEIQKWIADKNILKEIIVPQKLVNLVIAN